MIEQHNTSTSVAGVRGRAVSEAAGGRRPNGKTDKCFASCADVHVNGQRPLQRARMPPSSLRHAGPRSLAAPLERPSGRCRAAATQFAAAATANRTQRAVRRSSVESKAASSRCRCPTRASLLRRTSLVRSEAGCATARGLRLSARLRTRMARTCARARTVFFPLFSRKVATMRQTVVFSRSSVVLALLLLRSAGAEPSSLLAPPANVGAAVVATAGNTAACANSSACPCGAAPPVWPAAVWQDAGVGAAGAGAGAALWCPLGCAAPDDPFAPDTSGELMVALDGACAGAAFSAWSSPSASFLGTTGCPLSAWPAISLRHFTPCVNTTALAAGAPAPCTPCALLPSAPSPPLPPPPAVPSAPPPDAPAGSIQVVTITLCLVRDACLP